MQSNEKYKQILGVHRQTTNIGVLLELGRQTLDIECIKLGIKNWERIRGGNANKLIIDCLDDALKEDLPWVVKIKEYLSDNNLDNLPANQKGTPFIYKKMYETLSKKFDINAILTINNPKSKLRTYALFKTNIGMENYLQETRNLSIRIQFSKGWHSRACQSC